MQEQPEEDPNQRRNRYQEKLTKITVEATSGRPLGLEQLKQAAEQLENADDTLDPFATVTADENFIYFPDATRHRRHVHRWRDATQAEIETQKDQEVHIVEGDDDADFFEEFMQNARPEFMCNLNPTILNAL